MTAASAQAGGALWKQRQRKLPLRFSASPARVPVMNAEASRERHRVVMLALARDPPRVQARCAATGVAATAMLVEVDAKPPRAHASTGA